MYNIRTKDKDGDLKSPHEYAEKRETQGKS